MERKTLLAMGEKAKSNQGSQWWPAPPGPLRSELAPTNVTTRTAGVGCTPAKRCLVISQVLWCPLGATGGVLQKQQIWWKSDLNATWPYWLQTDLKLTRCVENSTGFRRVCRKSLKCPPNMLEMFYISNTHVDLYSPWTSPMLEICQISNRYVGNKSKFQQICWKQIKFPI